MPNNSTPGRLLVIASLILWLRPGYGADVTVQPGNESQISTELNAGNNVLLVGASTYTLSASEAIRITASHVTLDGQGATLQLDTSFDNHFYDPLKLHGNVHCGANPRPLATAFGIYVGPRCQNVTLKNFKITRQPVDGSVVRSIGLVKSSRLYVTNVELTGDTIGPLIDVVDCEGVTIENCRIHDVMAINKSGRLNLAGTGKPNLTGILVDDVDLLDNEQRENDSLHSCHIHIAYCEIKNLSMHDSVAIRQTDGINIQRGRDYSICKCFILNCDEGIDTFGSCGLISHNTIKLDPYDSNASAGIKLIHGANHNFVVENNIINRKVLTIVDQSPLPSLDWHNGVYRNVIAKNSASGQGDKMWRISVTQGGANPNANMLVGNSGGTYSSDYPSAEEPNFFWTSAEPLSFLGDFNADHRPDLLVVESNGATRVYVSCQKGAPWQVTTNLGLINNITNPLDVTLMDFTGDGATDVTLQVGYNPFVRRLFSCQPASRSFRYVGEVSY